MRYSTRVLLLQLATVVAVVAVCTGIFGWLSWQRLKDDAVTTAMAIARSVAASPQVRADVAAATGDSRPSPDSAVQHYATDTATRTGALFVVVTDRNGTRLAHPDPSRLGETVSTDHDAALRGEEVTAWESGTLGPSARAKVPVFAPGSTEPVGEVSVGFRRSSVSADLPRNLAGIGAAAAVALLLGAVASVLMKRRGELVTLGLQPEELAELVRAQAAVLDGVGDGVVSLDDDGVVRLLNSTAVGFLGVPTTPGAVPTVVGHHFSGLGLPAGVVDRLTEGLPCGPVVVGDRILYLDARPVERDGRRLGSIVVVRDRTDIVALSGRLSSVSSMGSALRVQRHEFANRVHVVAGLLDAGRPGDARAFLGELADRGPVDVPLHNASLLTEPFLQSFLGAKSTEAAERGVDLGIGEDTLVLGPVVSATAAEDIATVLGNLTDNAVAAAIAAAAGGSGVRRPRVEVTALQDGDNLILTVADSGQGWDGGSSEEPVDPVVPTGDTVHGHGIGLALVRDLVRRRGGELWVIDPGGRRQGQDDLTGAVIGVRLPGVIATVGMTGVGS